MYGYSTAAYYNHEQISVLDDRRYWTETHKK